MSNLRISLVTPSYNAEKFIRRTIISILQQGYRNLEYIVQDGGSTDGTQAILGEYSSRFAYCTSHADKGQYDAINQGFSLATGDVMAWLNADDIYLPGTLSLVATMFERFPQVRWLTTRYPLAIDENDHLISTSVVPGFNAHSFHCGDNLPALGWEGTVFIQQESTFWRRSLWEESGGHLDRDLQYAADFDLWARFFRHDELYAIDVPLACFRKHGAQKTSTAFDRYLEEAALVFARIGGRVPNRLWQALRLRIATKQLVASGRFGWQKQLFKPSKRLVYSWADDTWKVVEY